MNINDVANIGRLIGEPARTNMLLTLMHGQALTSKELARCANVTPQTASGHLAKLVEAGLLSVQKQGRHRYHKIASPEIAKLIETVCGIASAQSLESPRVVTGPRDPAMRMARTCYDHFAGRLGVAITDSLIEKRYLLFNEEAGVISKKGILHLASCGIDVSAANQKPGSKRPVCRPCLDWSERRPHVAGIVGAAICSYFFKHKLIKRIDESRALKLTRKGELALSEMFGIGSLE